MTDLESGAVRARARSTRTALVWQRLDGSWTEETLDAFLRDAASVALGNRMRFPGSADPAERQLIIDYLATREYD